MGPRMPAQAPQPGDSSNSHITFTPKKRMLKSLLSKDGVGAFPEGVFLLRSKSLKRKFHFFLCWEPGETSDMGRRWTYSQEMPLSIHFKEV